MRGLCERKWQLFQGLSRYKRLRRTIDFHHPFSGMTSEELPEFGFREYHRRRASPRPDRPVFTYPIHLDGKRLSWKRAIEKGLRESPMENMPRFHSAKAAKKCSPVPFQAKYLRVCPEILGFDNDSL